MPHTKITYDSFANLGKILEQANLEIYPDFVAPETRDKFFAEYAYDTQEKCKKAALCSSQSCAGKDCTGVSDVSICR